MIDVLAAALHANACAVLGPVPVADAQGLVVARVAVHAVNGTAAVAAGDPTVVALDLVAALRAAGQAVLLPDDPQWSAQLPDAAAGVTGAVLATVDPAAFALVAGPGQPRATSLVPPVHVCVLRTQAVVATFAEAMATLVTTALPSVVTWIGGPSRTGDLEMVTTLGVHGPRIVEVVLVE